MVVAVYPAPYSARKDFDAFVKLADGGTARTESAILVTRDAEGQVRVHEADELH